MVAPGCAMSSGFGSGGVEVLEGKVGLRSWGWVGLCERSATGKDGSGLYGVETSLK